MMSISITFNSAYRILLASEFFMARRPVMDRLQKPVAHELLFCSAQAEGDACLTAIDNDQPAAASVIEDVCKHGMMRVLGDLDGILHIDEAALMSDSILLLPQHRFILEFAPRGAPGADVLERIRRLARMGFRFCLAHGAASDACALEDVLPLMESVRIDIAGRDAAALQQQSARYRNHGMKLLAGSVESAEQYRRCAEFGFDYFQGYYFAAPQVLGGKKLSPSQQAITELLALVVSDADDSVIEHSIKSDVSLGLNLLRLANTPAVTTHRIDSLRQALMVLGRNQLQRWLQLMLYAEPGVHGSGVLALASLAATRGRLMELVAQKLKPGNRSIADTAFTVGIMSLMETLFSMPLEDILRQMPVGEEVASALQGRRGFYGKLLMLAEYTEWRQKSDQLLPLIRELKLSYSELYLLQLAAFEWSDQITRGLH